MKNLIIALALGLFEIQGASAANYTCSITVMEKEKILATGLTYAGHMNHTTGWIFFKKIASTWKTKTELYASGWISGDDGIEKAKFTVFKTESNRKNKILSKVELASTEVNGSDHFIFDYEEFKTVIICSVKK